MERIVSDAFFVRDGRFVHAGVANLRVCVQLRLADDRLHDCSYALMRQLFFPTEYVTLSFFGADAER